MPRDLYCHFYRAKKRDGKRGVGRISFQHLYTSGSELRFGRLAVHVARLTLHQGAAHSGSARLPNARERLRRGEGRGRTRSAIPNSAGIDFRLPKRQRTGIERVPARVWDKCDPAWAS
jgi:hypothetical protein